jgi:LysR family transcriptional regulator, transcriptional activator of the cysJI operon
MNLNQLKIFYLTAKFRNLSAAAENLNVTQPAVTKGIQRLEEHYEIKVFNRFGKKLVLTDAGRVLYGIAEQIFEMETQAEESIRDFQQEKRGHILIDSSESFGAYCLPDIIIPFSKANPLIRVSANILPTQKVVENTVALDNDLGFISYPIEHKKLLIKEILEDRLVIITPTGHPFTRKTCIEPQALEGQTMIMHERGSAPRKAINQFLKENNINVFVHLELSSNRAIKKAVEQGIGLAIISQTVVSDEIQTGKLETIPLCDGSMKRKFYMIHHKDKYLSVSLQNFINTVYKWVSDYSKGLLSSDLL